MHNKDTLYLHLGLADNHRQNKLSLQAGSAVFSLVKGVAAMNVGAIVTDSCLPIVISRSFPWGPNFLPQAGPARRSFENLPEWYQFGFFCSWGVIASIGLWGLAVLWVRLP